MTFNINMFGATYLTKDILVLVVHHASIEAFVPSLQTKRDFYQTFIVAAHCSISDLYQAFPMAGL